MISQDIRIGQGDDSPTHAWGFSVPIAGLGFELTVKYLPKGILWVIPTGAALVSDPVGNTVTWFPTLLETSTLPLGRDATYNLRVASPFRQSWAGGRVLVFDGPVGNSQVDIDPALTPAIVAALIAQAFADRDHAAAVQMQISLGVL